MMSAEWERGLPRARNPAGLRDREDGRTLGMTPQWGDMGFICFVCTPRCTDHLIHRHKMLGGGRGPALKFVLF